MDRKLAAVAIGVALLVAGVPAGAQEPSPGTVRIAWDGAEFRFDPASEYDSITWEIYSSLLLRTLVSYPHTAGAQGNELVADLAVELPEPTDGGLTYTFDLKPGVMFGPPVSRAITSKDVKYAFKRMVCRKCSGLASYNFYYTGVIDGMRSNRNSIEGIDTPDDDTIVFHLSEPTGDFLHRLALPATAPVPKEVARCFPPEQGGYGRRLVASGPYMIEGSEELAISDGCRSMEPISGYSYGEQNLSLVPNPDYDPATDTIEIREPVFQRFEFLNMSDLEAFNGIEEGHIDAAMLTPSRRRVAGYQEDSDPYPAVHSNLEDVTWYASMNLTQKPFDDVHVRRALNFALDRGAVQEAWGGDTWAEIATHVLPPTLTSGGSTSGYDPYGAATGPQLERAHDEMTASRYDDNGDGLCDAAACNGVKLVNRDEEPWLSAEPAVVDALEAIGITPEVRRANISEAYTLVGDISRGIPMGMNAGWAKDFGDASTYFAYLFHSDALEECSFTVNYSLVGATSETKKRCDAPGRFRNVPSVDADIDACMAITDDGDRDNCWVELDARMTEEVVPWIPLLWRKAVHVTGERIGHFEFDQWTGQISLAHIQP